MYNFFYLHIILDHAVNTSPSIPRTIVLVCFSDRYEIGTQSFKYQLTTLEYPVGLWPAASWTTLRRTSPDSRSTPCRSCLSARVGTCYRAPSGTKLTDFYAAKCGSALRSWSSSCSGQSSLRERETVRAQIDPRVFNYIAMTRTNLVSHN